uniref:General transcription factor IIF subunit 2 n=2 Tax=Ditylenchus dipsaci TaxID=166011 RepID=A0A915DH58_9BILA
MGPHLPENSHNTGINGDTNSDEENHLEVPENDGWRIGYEVEMNGIGIVNVYDVGQNADTSDNSCSSDSSEDVDDDDSEAKRAGYRPLLTDAPLKSTEAEAETYEDKYHAGTSKYTWREADKIPHVNLPPIVDKNCYTIPHKPVDIPLDEGRIMNSKKRATPESDSLVNCEKANRGIWLVKVPRYLSEVWEKMLEAKLGNWSQALAKAAQNNISRPSSLTAGNEIKKPMVKGAAKTAEIPDEHRFLIGDLNNQTMAVLCEDKSGLEEEANFRTGKLSVEGRVSGEKAECQPPNSLSYMKMKIRQIETVSQPKQYVQTMDRAVVKFKPTNLHKENFAKDKAKKDGAKTVRGDLDTVRQAVFHAFEKHQYYKLVDLQNLTKQPTGFLKEILMDIANYNTAPPHKSMWELKPEYRNYDASTS